MQLELKIHILDSLTSMMWSHLYLCVFTQVIAHGLACKSGLRVGDRILEVNTTDLRHATHQEAVRALLSNKNEIRMLVRRDPSPPGMQVHTHTHTHVYAISPSGWLRVDQDLHLTADIKGAGGDQGSLESVWIDFASFEPCPCHHTLVSFQTSPCRHTLVSIQTCPCHHTVTLLRHSRHVLVVTLLCHSRGEVRAFCRREMLRFRRALVVSLLFTPFS